MVPALVSAFRANDNHGPGSQRTLTHRELTSGDTMKRLYSIILPVVLFTNSVAAAEPDEFIISYWAGPPSGGNYDAQYAEVAECNFTHAMFPVNGASPEQNKAILDACGKHGLKYFVFDSRMLASPPNDPQFAKNLDAIIAEYGDHPALAGYFLVDEPGPGAFPLLADVNQYLLKKNPEQLPVINLLPIYVDENYIGGSYDHYVEQFCSTVKPKILCYDHYALFEKVERDSYFENLEIIRRHALKNGIPFGFIFQCTPHGTYRDPSETDLRWQVNTALAYGCKALLYFTYFTPTDADSNFHNGILDRNGNHTSHFAMAKDINRELKAFGPTLVKLTSTAVYHTEPVPKGCTRLPATAPVQIKGDGQLVIGFLGDSDRTRWAIVVNRDLHRPTQVRLLFDNDTVDELQLQTCKLSSTQLVDRQLSIGLPPAGIKILKLGKDPAAK
jgi:hypothetical protein